MAHHDAILRLRHRAETHANVPVRPLISVFLALKLLSFLIGCGGGSAPAEPSNLIAPSIRTQPASESVTLGQTATFTVVAAGTAPLAYQWQKGGANIAGANSSTYTTPPTNTSDDGSRFRVLVSNSAGTVTRIGRASRMERAEQPPAIH